MEVNQCEIAQLIISMLLNTLCFLNPIFIRSLVIHWVELFCHFI